MFVALAVLGVAALAATSLIAGREDSGTASSTETTDVSVPDSESPPPTDEQLEPVETDPVDITTTEITQPESAPDDLFPETDPVAPPAPATWTTDVFAPPAALLGAEVPTTMVLLTRNGVLRELDLSTGTAVELDTGSTLGQTQVLVGRSGTLISGGRGDFGDGTAVLYRAGEPPIDLGGATGQANFAVRPNSDEFVGFLFATGPRDYIDLVVGPDGSLDQTATSLDDARPPWTRRYGPNGNQTFSEGGAVFEEGPDGTVVRLTDGEVLATSSHHTLVRECDADYVCNSVLIDGTSGERQTVQLGPKYAPTFVAGTGQISPDGSKLWFARFEQGATEFIMDLSTGEAIDIGRGGGFVDRGPTTPSYVWTADSAGVIRSTLNSLEFVDAATGERVEFATEYPGAVAFGVRLDIGGVAPPPVFEPTDTDIQIAGYGDAAVHRIDIDTGEIATVESTSIGSGAPIYVMSDPSGISVVAYDNVDGIRVENGVSTPIVDGPFGSLMIAGPRPDTLWVPGSRSDGGSPGVYDLYDSLGESLEGTIRLPKGAEGGAAGADGNGGIVSQSELGGAYAIGQSDVVRITTGELLALGPTTAIADECDDAYQCGVVVIDRLTGDRSAFDDLVLASVIAPPPSPTFLNGHSVAPSGDVALLFNEVSGEFVFADLVSGQTVAAPAPAADSTVVWSDDGRAAVYLTNGRLQLYERATASMRILDQFPQLRSISELASAVPDGLANRPAPFPF